MTTLKNVKKQKPQSTSGTTESSDNSSKQTLDNTEFYSWKKGVDIKLSTHFNSKEFTCHCNFPDCINQRISKQLIDKLEIIRVEIDQPLIVTSGFRCMKHQAFLRAAGVNTVVAKQSQHELGNAADIVPEDQNNIRTTFLETVESEFDSIGLSDNFLHVDLRQGKRRWEY